ncbi:MAG: ABC transporter permease, partial [Flavobacteriaceae bacterium]
MIHSWFQIFIRHLKKNPLYPIINTLGLTLGITCFILVTLFVSHETSYEKWNPNLENIYRPIRLFDNGEVWNTAPYIMVTKAQEELPEIEDALILGWDGSLLFNNEGKKLVKGMRRTTSNFFDFYPYPLKYGNKEQLFVNENDLVLSDEFAFELFGDSNPVGQVVHTTYQNKAKSFTITGVYITKDYPSDVQPPILRLIKKQSEFTEGQLQWGNFNYDALFKMHPNTDIAAFIKKFDEFYDTNTAKSWSTPLEEY